MLLVAHPPQLPLAKHGRDLIGAVEHCVANLAIELPQGLGMIGGRIEGKAGGGERLAGVGTEGSGKTFDKLGWVAACEYVIHLSAR